MKTTNEASIQELLEESKIEQELVDTIMNMIIDNREKTTYPIYDSGEEEFKIRRQILLEEDWKKKAQLSALLLSQTLDN